MVSMEILRYEDEWPWGKCTTLCYADGKGMVAISFDKNNLDGFISGLKVHKSARNEGRGNELLSLAENEIKNTANRHHATLCVVPNSWQHLWYERHGYTEWKESPCSIEGYMDLHKNL